MTNGKGKNSKKSENEARIPKTKKGGVDRSPDARRGRKLLARNYDSVHAELRRRARKLARRVSQYDSTVTADDIIQEAVEKLLHHPEKLVNALSLLAVIYWAARKKVLDLYRKNERRERLAPVVNPSDGQHYGEAPDNTAFDNTFVVQSCPIYEAMRARDMLEGILKHLAEYAAGGLEHARNAEVYQRHRLDGVSPEVLARERSVKRGTIYQWEKPVQTFLESQRHMLEG